MRLRRHTGIRDDAGTLYVRLGRRDGIAVVVETVCDRVLADDRLAADFEGMAIDELRSHRTAFLSAVAGGTGSTTGGTCVRPTTTSTSTIRTFTAAAHLDAALAAHDVSVADRETALGEIQSVEGTILNR